MELQDLSKNISNRQQNTATFREVPLRLVTTQQLTERYTLDDAGEIRQGKWYFHENHQNLIN